MTRKVFAGVNFINILCMCFLYKSLCGAFFYLHFSFVIFWRQNFGQKTHVLHVDEIDGRNRAFGGIGFIGHYFKGQPRGFCWKGLSGSSWIYGEVNSEGEFTGEFEFKWEVFIV